MKDLHQVAGLIDQSALLILSLWGLMLSRGFDYRLNRIYLSALRRLVRRVALFFLLWR